MQINSQKQTRFSFGSAYKFSMDGLPKLQKDFVAGTVKNKYNGIVPRKADGFVRVSMDIEDDAPFEKMISMLGVKKVSKVEHHDVQRTALYRVLDTGVYRKVKKPVETKSF